MSKQVSMLSLITLCLLNLILRQINLGENVALAQDISSPIVAFDFNATVDKYATGHSDRTIRTWDADTNQLIHTVEGPDLRQPSSVDSFTITTVVFNPTGDKLAVSFGGSIANGLILIMDTENARTTLEISTGVYTAPITWSPDGNQLAGMRIFYRDTNPISYLTLWDANTGEVLNEYQMRQSAPLSLDWHPTQDELAFTRSDNIVVWDILQWQPVSTLSAHTGGAPSVEWSPDGES